MQPEMRPRIGAVQEKVNEGTITVLLALDGEPITGYFNHPLATMENGTHIWIRTGIEFLDTMLSFMTRAARWSLYVDVQGQPSDANTGIQVLRVLGLAFSKAVGNQAEREGLRRFGNAQVPSQDALANAAIDIADYSHFSADFGFEPDVEAIISHITYRGLEVFSEAAEICLHVDVLKGDNDMYCVEAGFLSVAAAIRAAIERIPDGGRIYGPAPASSSLSRSV